MSGRGAGRLRQLVAAGLLLAAGLAGCRHQGPPPALPAAAPPSIAPDNTPGPITVITPLPSVPPGAKPDVQPAPPELPAPTPIPVKQTRRRHKNHAPSVAAEEPATTPKQSAAADSPPASTPGVASTIAGATTAAAAATEAAPVLGELSTGTAISSSERNHLLGEIQSLKTRLSKLPQPKTQDALAVAMQVKTFLARAREAVDQNDLDGAHTLDTKARVLLSELEGE